MKLRVVIAAFTAVLFTAACSTPSTSLEAAPVTVSGAVLPSFDTTQDVDLAVGLPAPQVVGVGFDGEPVSIGDGPALVVFVAHWCNHCQAEIPVLVDWVDNGGRLPVHVVATAEAPQRGNHPASMWLSREGWQTPVLRDDASGSTLGAYGMAAFPAFVAVDSTGRVAGRNVGQVPVEALNRIADMLLP